jgi:hypothetical protein
MAMSVTGIGGRRPSFIAALLMLVMCTSSSAHHQTAREGATVGVAIPSITHGEMPIIAKYRGYILDLAATQPRTDATLRRLADFVKLQYFACFYGLVPGSLSDDSSPFNECSHAYLAAARALLGYMAAMPGDQSAAKALDARIDAEISSDPTFAVLCSNSDTQFDSGVIVGPDWRLAMAHLPTVMTFSITTFLAAAGLWAAFRRHS